MCELPNDVAADGDLAISIVSHGQGHLVRSVLTDLASVVTDRVRVIVTINIPESEAFLEAAAYPVTVVRNSSPKGFGANHNHAFTLSRSKFFAVLNPDIRCEGGVFAATMRILDSTHIGVCGPLVRGPNGNVEDSARRFPTVSRIVRRVVERVLSRPTALDYEISDSAIVDVEWIAGMFMLFRSSAFAEVGGFDERYYMYLEDADICLRLRTSGWTVCLLRDVSIVHDSRRATMRDFRHFTWHAVSMAKFLLRTTL